MPLLDRITQTSDSLTHSKRPDDFKPANWGQMNFTMASSTSMGWMRPIEIHRIQKAAWQSATTDGMSTTPTTTQGSSCLVYSVAGIGVCCPKRTGRPRVRSRARMTKSPDQSARPNHGWPGIGTLGLTACRPRESVSVFSLVQPFRTDLAGTASSAPDSANRRTKPAQKASRIRKGNEAHLQAPALGELLQGWA